MPIKINNYSPELFTTVLIYDLLILYYCIIRLLPDSLSVIIEKQCVLNEPMTARYTPVMFSAHCD